MLIPKQLVFVTQNNYQIFCVWKFPLLYADGEQNKFKVYMAALKNMWSE